MRVFSTFIAWSNENKSCMRVEKREFTWEFSQRSLLDQTSCMRVDKREFTYHESFLNIHCLIKREQELHESWEARVYMTVFSTFIAWSKNTSCMRVDKREFTYHESFLNIHCLIKREQELHESFLNFHCLIKREQELHESWEARVYMRVFSTFIAWSNENKSCVRVESLHESFLNIHCLIKREHELHESWQARVYIWEFSQHSLLDQTRTRVAWELTSESLHMRVFSTFIAWSNENKSCMRVEKREFTWEFSQHSLPDQTRTRVAFDSSILWIGI